MIDVSIIVPVYNAEKYLRDSVQSMRDQTDPNIEILLVDDGSTDQSPALCAEFARQDSRVRVLRQENAGPGIARNTGLNAAQGEYVYFADADDKMAPDLVAEALAAIRAAGADIAVFGHETVKFNQAGEASSTVRLPSRSGIYTYDEFWERFDPESSMSLWVRLFRRAYLEEHHLRFTDLRNGEDGFFILDCYLAGFHKIVFLQKALYTYYHRTASSTLRYSQGRSDAEYRIACRYGEVLEKIPQARGRFRVAIDRFTLTKLTIFITCVVSDDRLSRQEKRGLLKEFANRPVIKKALGDLKATLSFGKTQAIKFTFLRLRLYGLVLRLAKPWHYQ